MTGIVAARPAWGIPEKNSYPSHFSQELVGAGIEVVEALPGGWRRVVDRSTADGPHALHIHWPEHLVAPRHGLPSDAWNVVARQWIGHVRRRGCSVIWTVHNVEAHRTATKDTRTDRVASDFVRWFVDQVDGCVFVSEATRSTTLERFPRLATIPSTLIRHGCYDSPTAKQRAADAGGAARVVVPGRPAPHRSIANRRSQDIIDRLVGDGFEVHSSDPQLDGVLPAENLPDRGSMAFSEALQSYDAVLLPHVHERANSGLLVHALSAGVPVIAPENRLTAEFAELVPGGVFGYSGDRLVDAGTVLAVDRRDIQAATARGFAWAGTGEAYLELLRAVEGGIQPSPTRAGALP